MWAVLGRLNSLFTCFIFRDFKVFQSCVLAYTYLASISSKLFAPMIYICEKHGHAGPFPFKMLKSLFSQSNLMIIQYYFDLQCTFTFINNNFKDH